MKKISGLSNAFTSLSKSIENDFLQSSQVVKDYWELWFQCGLLDYCCKKIKAKFRVPSLDEDLDYEYVEIPVGENNSHVIEGSAWYRFNKRKKSFDKKLDSVIRQLRLPCNSKDTLLFKILYDKPLKKPYGVNFELMMRLMNDEPLGNTSPGLTMSEIESMKGFLSMGFSGASDRLNMSQSEINKIIDSIDTKLVVRKYRPLKNFKRKLLTIEYAKRYGELEEERDFNSDEFCNVRQTSEVISSKIYSDIDDEINITASSYRKELSRLKKNFPLLKEFLATFSS